MLELYKNIKHLREEMGMSQDTLAKLTGYSDRSSITKIEKGQVDLQQSKIELFAKALNTTPRKLVGYKDFYSPENAILHAHMTEDVQYTELYKVWTQLNDTGKQKLIDNANDLVQIYNNN